MALDLRTDKQKARDAKHAKIISDFLAVKAQTPSASNNQRIEHVAQLHQLTGAGVRKILKERNII